MFQMLGIFAEFERGIIRERVNAGLARARANGTKLGRRSIKPSVEARILELRAKSDVRGSSRRLPDRYGEKPRSDEGGAPWHADEGGW
jgi:DNA invertase Pin-like site-specific DNA recombinase